MELTGVWKRIRDLQKAHDGLIDLSDDMVEELEDLDDEEALKLYNKMAKMIGKIGILDDLTTSIENTEVKLTKDFEAKQDQIENLIEELDFPAEKKKPDKKAKGKAKGKGKGKGDEVTY